MLLILPYDLLVKLGIARDKKRFCFIEIDILTGVVTKILYFIKQVKALLDSACCFILLMTSIIQQPGDNEMLFNVKSLLKVLLQITLGISLTSNLIQ